MYDDQRHAASHEDFLLTVCVRVCVRERARERERESRRERERENENNVRVCVTDHTGDCAPVRLALCR